MKVVPQDRWILFSHQIIHHGRALCQARKPRCAECLLDPHLLRERQDHVTYKLAFTNF